MKRKVLGHTNTNDPWIPPEVAPADIVAIQALCRGDANEQQQIKVIEWLKRATAVSEMSYRASDRDTAFAEGKRFVGLQFFTLAKAALPPEKAS